MNNSTANSPNSRALKSLGSSGQLNGGQGTGTGVGGKEPQSAYGAKIAQTALQSVGVSTMDFPCANGGTPEYAAAVSILFTKAANQAIMLGTEPRHVLSTALLYNSLLYDKRFKRVPMSEAAPGDIVIASSRHQAMGYVGIVVDHGRIVNMGTAGTVQNNHNVAELERSRQEMSIFRYIGVQTRPSFPFANAGYDPNEPRLPAGQHGGGQWTGFGAEGGQNGKGNAQMAPSTLVLSGGNQWKPGDKTSDIPAPGAAAASPSKDSKAYFVNKTLFALAVKKPDGSVVIVLTKVKTQEQADRLGVPVGTDVPIFVPPGKNPQVLVDRWSRPTGKTPMDFYETWKPGGRNDYKKRVDPIYDAYGNFEYGATGAAYGLTKGEIEGGGDIAAFSQHHAFNNPINRADIGAGHGVISGGGKLLTIPYKWAP